VIWRAWLRRFISRIIENNDTLEASDGGYTGNLAGSVSLSPGGLMRQVILVSVPFQSPESRRKPAESRTAPCRPAELDALDIHGLISPNG